MDITPSRLPQHYIVNDDELEYILSYGYPSKGQNKPRKCTQSILSTIALFDTTALPCTDMLGETALIPHIFMQKISNMNTDDTDDMNSYQQIETEHILASEAPLPHSRHIHTAGTFKRKFSQGMSLPTSFTCSVTRSLLMSNNPNPNPNPIPGSHYQL